jgi:hypothetical protein
MLHRPKEPKIEDRPIELKDLADVLPDAPPPYNWSLTFAEKQANIEVLRTLEILAKCPDLKTIGLFLQNAIVAAQIGARPHPNTMRWDQLEEMSPVVDLLCQIPLRKWPIPKNHACFHPFCDHVVNEAQSSHLQRAHNRKNLLNSEKDRKIKRVWNGESALQATMADLLNIWCVAETGAKYCNAYAPREERRVSTFKALAETWQIPEVRDWHKYLGDFWGPIIQHLRRHGEWMPIAAAFETGVGHGFCLKENNEIIASWDRGTCNPDPNSPIRAIFQPLLGEIQQAYANDDYDFPNNVLAKLDLSPLNIPDSPRDLIPVDQDWDLLSLEPGKSHPQVFQWVTDFQSLIDRNKETVLTALQTHDEHMQEKLEEMVDRMKNLWKAANEEQRAAWNETKRQTFGTTDLQTKLIDVICSFESRWIPQEHCACPICWESGSQQRFSNLPDFVNHMKNVHHVGWKNVKDYWCMTFTKVLGKCVYRKITSGPGHLDTEMGNAFAICPYPKCKHSQDRGSSFIKHFEKEHKHKTVPAMGIWSLIIDHLQASPDANIAQLLNQKSGFACTKCAFFSNSQRSVEDHCRMKHAPGEAECVPCQSSPAIRPGEGEGDDPDLQMQVDALIQQTQAKHGTWTREEAEETGIRWYHECMARWSQGVQEKNQGESGKMAAFRFSYRAVSYRCGKLGRVFPSKRFKDCMKCQSGCKDRR